MKELFLSALTGKFSKWRYYLIIMKVGDIIENFGDESHQNFRIKTVEEVEVIYSKKGVSNYLQRAYDSRRLNPIKKYLLDQPDNYINNLTIAIFDGNPNWLGLDLNKVGDLEEQSEDNFERIEKTFGVIHLTGEETLFVLDGQHRLKALREAVIENEDLKDQEIAITLISHRQDIEGIKRTRRLFSTINRHAKPVSDGENILLDEDDVSAIIVRNLIEEYPLFKGNDVIALNKTANLSKSDIRLTTVISLWNINETLIEHSNLYSITTTRNIYLKIRPSDDKIEIETEKIFKYWDHFFKVFPNAKKFINESKNSKKNYRREGGSFFLRPIGQEIVAKLYKHMIDSNNRQAIERISEIEENLNSDFWKFVLWDPYKNKMINRKPYACNYLLYNFGLLPDKKIIELRNNFKKSSGEQELELPPPRYK